MLLVSAQMGDMRKKKEERLGFLVRKYFNTWLEITRRHRIRHPDVDHQSVFPVTNKMAGTVDELKDESGVGKFLLNMHVILKVPYSIVINHTIPGCSNDLIFSSAKS